MKYNKESLIDNKNTPRGFTRNEITRFKDRLKQAIGDESGNSFAKRCGISEAAVRAYLSGKTYPSLDKLAILAEKCEVPISWLANGDHAIDDSSLIPDHVTESQEKIWREFLHRMTAIEREAIIDSVVRKGLNVLLSPIQSTQQASQEIHTVSNQALAVARIFEALPPEEQKSFLESFKEEKHDKTSLENGRKREAS